MLEGRRAQFVHEVAGAEGLSKSKAAAVVDATIDRWVWYAGWTDKIAQVVGGANPVAGPYFNLSSPEPTGVVAVLAPQESSFLGLVLVLAPVVATGNTAVVVASERSPLPALSLAEVLATSDVPGGVVNILSGRTAEIAAPLAAHQDVNAIDLAGADEALAKELETAAADNLKRVVHFHHLGRLGRRPGPGASDGVPGDQDGLAHDGRAGRRRFVVLTRPGPPPGPGRASPPSGEARPAWPLTRVALSTSSVARPATGIVPTDSACATGPVRAVDVSGGRSATWVPTPLSSGSTPVPASGLGRPVAAAGGAPARAATAGSTGCAVARCSGRLAAAEARGRAARGECPVGTGPLRSPALHVVQTRDHCAGAVAVQLVHLAPPVVEFWCPARCVPRAEDPAGVTSSPCPPTVTALSQRPVTGATPFLLMVRR
ncbi:Gamma-aminobutyraldehyde dehydrogenase [Streptomyces fumanus]